MPSNPASNSSPSAAPAPTKRLSWQAFLNSRALPTAVLSLTLVLTWWVWRESTLSAEKVTRLNFRELIDGVQHRINDRISDCASVLLGGVGLFSVHGEVTREDWRHYFEQLRPTETLAGVQGVGFSLRIPASELATHTARIRAEGFPEYSVRPEFSREEYHSIILIEPFRERNLRAFGYDMATEKTRRQAMDQACDEGQPTLSGPVTLVQEIPGQNIQQGFLLYAPVYARGAPVNTVAARRKALRGFVYSPFRAGDFVDQSFFLEPTGLALEIFAGSDAETRRQLYDSRASPRSPPTPPGFVPAYTETVQLRLLGRPWTLVFTSLPQFEAAQNRSKAPLVLALGLACSFLVSGFVFALNHQSRARARLEQISDDLTRAHSELERRVTERTAEIARLSARFQGLLTVASDGIHVVDESGRLHDCSESFRRMLGYTAAETTDLVVADWDAQLPRTELGPLISRIIGEPSVFETLHRRKDGTVFPVEINARGITLDGRRYLYASSRDISVRRQLEVARQEALDRLQKIASRLPGVVYQFRLRPDGTSCFPFASDTIREIYGVTPAEVRDDASKVFAAIHPDDHAGIVDSIRKSARELTTWSQEYRVKLPGHTEQWLLGNSVPEREPDGSILWHGFITDITERKGADARARATEQSYRDQFTRNSAVMLLVNPLNGRIVDANPAALRFYGYSHDVMISKVITEINVMDAEEIRRAMASVSPDSGSQFHFLHRLADGSLRHVAVSSSRIQRGPEELLHSIIFDITERVRAEAALQETQQQLAWAMDQAHLAYWEFSLQDRLFTFNDQLYSLYGTSVESEGGYAMSIEDYVQAFLFPDEQPLLFDQVRQAALSGFPESRLEHRIRRRDGEIRHITVRLEAVRDEQGRPRRIRGASQDITERRRSEEALRQSEASFRSLVSAMAEGLVLQRADGAIVDCNQQAEKILGLTRDQLRGRSSLGPDWLLLREDGTSFTDSEHPAMITLRTGQRCTNVAMGLRQSGDTLRWINVNTEPLLHAGETRPHAVVITFTDISEKIYENRKLQELLSQTERDARLKADLLREVNHRVTNNLTSVLGLLAFEAHSAASENSPAVTEVLKRLSERLRSLLEVHRMIAQAGWVPVQVDRLAARVIRGALAAAAWPQAPIVTIAPSPLLVSPRQASSLALLFSELTTNTVKYAGQADRPVEIHVTSEHAADGGAVLTYCDNGPGYPPDVLAQRRSHIGLRLIREIVATTLRGTVEFTNSPGAHASIRLRAEEETRT